MKYLLLSLIFCGCSTVQTTTIPTTPTHLSKTSITIDTQQDVLPVNNTITLSWTFPTELETPDLVFNIYHTYDLTEAPNHWLLLCVLAGSQRSVILNATEPQEFFVLTAQNSAGESAFGTNN